MDRSGLVWLLLGAGILWWLSSRAASGSQPDTLNPPPGYRYIVDELRGLVLERVT
jgi:hypothetical protein